MVPWAVKAAIVCAAVAMPTAGVPGAATGAAPPTAGVSASAGVRVEPLFSEPMFLPLRRAARVSCVNRNCRLSNGRHYHGDWALDLLGETGDPIHPAGSGIGHVGCASTGCKDDKTESRGKWVWVDHGAGVVTNYYHLQRIAIREGQAVTPDTLLGTMGATGGRNVPYLHFEKRQTDRTSRRVYPGPLWACLNGRARSFPGVLGYRNWDDIPKLSAWVRSQGTSCVRRPPRASRPKLVGAVPKVSRSTIRMKWRPPRQNPGAVRFYRVYVSLWHPWTNEWDDPLYYTVPAGVTVYRVPGLTFRRTYRLRVAALDSGGASPWSNRRDVVLANPPGHPYISRLESTRRSVFAKWHIPANGGNSITKYAATLMRGSLLVRSTRLGKTERQVLWTGLDRHTRYVLRVTASNQAGRGDPSVRRVTTR